MMDDFRKRLQSPGAKKLEEIFPAKEAGARRQFWRRALQQAIEHANCGDFELQERNVRLAETERWEHIVGREMTHAVGCSRGPLLRPHGPSREEVRREPAGPARALRKREFASLAEASNFLSTAAPSVRVKLVQQTVIPVKPLGDISLSGAPSSTSTYVPIASLLYVSRPKRKAASHELDTCRCPESGVCGAECELRASQRECNARRCPTGGRCSNQRLQQAMGARPPMEVFDAAGKGRGVRATAALQPGDLIVEYVGEVIDGSEVARRARLYALTGVEHFYFMSLDSDAFIDAHYKGNEGRFINHSCNPNACTEKWDVDGETRVAIVARKPIAPGDEISFDYQFESFSMDLKKCLCGEPNCRGFLGAPRSDAAAAAALNAAVDSPAESSIVKARNAFLADAKRARIEPEYLLALEMLGSASPMSPPCVSSTSSKSPVYLPRVLNRSMDRSRRDLFIIRTQLTKHSADEGIIKSE